MKMFVVFFLILSLFHEGISHSEGISKQFSSPNADVSVNASWTFNAVTNVTNVTVVVNDLKSAEWAALGLALNQSMGEAHVFICKRLANNSIVVNRYINPEGHHHPEPAGSEQGGTFTPGQQQFTEGVVTCQFSLSNFATQTLGQFKGIQPLSQSTKYHPLIANGLLDEKNEPRMHANDSRTAKADFVLLNQTEVVLYKINTANDGGNPKKTDPIIGSNIGGQKTIQFVEKQSIGKLLAEVKRSIVMKPKKLATWVAREIRKIKNN